MSIPEMKKKKKKKKKKIEKKLFVFQIIAFELGVANSRNLEHYTWDRQSMF